jgi:hypothetical protein
VVGRELVSIVELIGPEGSRLCRNDARGLDHVPGQFPRHAPALAPQDLKPGPQDFHVIEFFLRESIRRHDMQRISLDR